MYTPNRINIRVKLIAGKICENPEIMYIAVIPEKHSLENECFPNVQEKIKKDGGETVYGWQMWERGHFIEAEFHGVWKSPEREIIDITPKQEDRILFVTDPLKVYEGFQVNNIRLNLSGNPLVDDFLLIFDALYNLKNHGDKKYNNGKIIFEGKEAAIFSYLNACKDGLGIMMDIEGSNPGMNCFCGRGNPYYSCHQQDIHEAVKDVLKEFPV